MSTLIFSASDLALIRRCFAMGAPDQETASGLGFAPALADATEAIGLARPETPIMLAPGTQEMLSVVVQVGADMLGHRLTDAEAYRASHLAEHGTDAPVGFF
ncbi:MAG: hypothetical protein KGL52_09855 [Rhodospirillales bacterium]|jgi:hypothetical protein|nr:hypothetical protein [Rhodospirillales bacterium]